MKSIRNMIVMALTILLMSTLADAQDLVKYVQPMAGTATATTVSALKHGSTFARFANTIPAVGLPFGMTQWTPQTQFSENKCIPPYYYKDKQFSGIRGSHWISGSCMQDYGSLTIMPITGKLRITGYEATFDHADEVCAPDKYQINLKQYGVIAAVTATKRCGLMSFKAQKDDSLYLLITVNSDYQKGYIRIDERRGEIYGYNPVHRIYQGWGKSAGFSGYFVIRVEQDLSMTGTFSAGRISRADSIKNARNAGAFVGFKARKDQTFRIRVGTSFTSIDGARKNLDTEIPTFNFGQVANAAHAEWQKQLEKIKVTTSNEKDKRIFYTAFYHALQQPRLFNDVDGKYPLFAANYKNGVLKSGNYYDDFSMWDIYRAQIPLLEILDPPLVNDLVTSLIDKGRQGGWMPIFPCWNSYTSEMIGDHTTSVIASAYLKGIRNYDVNEAYQLLRHNAFDINTDRADYLEGKGRRALASYLKYGYIPVEDSVLDAFHKMEQTSRTMEYAYDDYALAMFAKKLNKTVDYKALIRRSGYYANVFDKSAGLVRGRHADGSWVTPFRPDGKETYITEGSPRQYTFYVPHDVFGLSRLIGGAAKLENSLDTLFARNEYWHGNEPGHQIPFMYNYTPSSWKTQDAVRKILASEYSDGPGGLGGNDDAGQMSSWYMFAALGFYPLNPVSGEYLLCSPIFDRSVIMLSAGKAFRIDTHRSSAAARYISRVTWNNRQVSPNMITYNMLKRGGKLEIYLTPAAKNKKQLQPND